MASARPYASLHLALDITTPAPHHSVFYRPDALPAAQPTVSKHWRNQYHGITVLIFYLFQLPMVKHHIWQKQKNNTDTDSG